MWLENEFTDLDTAMLLDGQSDSIVASSVFDGCGRSVVGGGMAVLNSAVTVGPHTQWALPSGAGLVTSTSFCSSRFVRAHFHQRCHVVLPTLRLYCSGLLANWRALGGTATKLGLQARSSKAAR